MEKIQLVTLNRALTLLDAIGAKYAIISPDGTRFGDLSIADDKPEDTRTYSFKELGAYVRDQFILHNVGDVAIIPIDKFDIDELQSAISSHAVKTGGKGSYTTCRSKDKKSIEVLRVM